MLRGADEPVRRRCQCTGRPARVDRQLPKRDSRVKAGSPALRRQPAAALMNAVARFRPPLLRAVVSTQRSPSRSASLFSQVECPAAGRTGTAAAGCELSQLREEQLPFPGENTLPFQVSAISLQRVSIAGGDGPRAADETDRPRPAVLIRHHRACLPAGSPMATWHGGKNGAVVARATTAGGRPHAIATHGG